MDLVGKWTTEGKINDGNKETLNTYWKQFEEYIHPQTNQLIAVVELKWLFQGTLSLEDFHTKAMRLVTQAAYEGDAKDQVLRDTIISGIVSDKIRAKIVKGHTVKINWVMEIARLEVSTQQHLDRMQETAKVNYVQYGKSTKSKNERGFLVILVNLQMCQSWHHVICNVLCTSCCVVFLLLPLSQDRFLGRCF